MTQVADTTLVVSLDEGTDEPTESAEPGASQEPAGRTQTDPSRSDGPPPIRPTLW